MHNKRYRLFLALLAALLLSVAPAAAQQDTGFVQWDWAKFSANFWRTDLPDPLTITPPPVYSGDLPALPVDVAEVQFADKLTDEQRALLAENGFVVVPAGLDWFDQAYMWDENWPSEEGTGWFVTTDSFLHTLHFIFDNLLADLERGLLANRMVAVVRPALEAARQQADEAAGTPLATAATNAVTYLSVADQLFSGEMTSADPAEQAIIQQALAGERQVNVPFLGERYMEDFSQYRPRGHYAGDETLEQYFRGMMWLSRITFLAKDETATQTALLVLRALRNAEGAYLNWQDANDVINFLIGNADDLGPAEYGTLADAVFGAELPLDALADSGRLTDFMARVKELPPPRINGLLLPPSTDAADIGEESRGFRLMGQRFTVDANVMQQLMDPYVGGRLLPSALDVAAALGSVTAQQLAEAQGAAEFPQYADNLAQQREAVNAIMQDEWLQTVYGAWLWTLQPLWQRDPQNLPAWLPPLMRTDAWTLKDLHTALASYTQLKHDTVLYAKPPGGLGGGGELFSYGYVEPNPQVFARIAVVAALTYEGLKQRGLTDINSNEFPEFRDDGTFSDVPLFNLQLSLGQLPTLAEFSAHMAELANKELRGEPLSEDDLMTLQGIGSYLSGVRVTLQDPSNPEPVALVTDIASAPMIGQVLQEGVGAVDTIYVVVPHPQGGLQMVRGGVFSYYEFVGDINQRMTDEEWRDKVKAGDLPPRPTWVSEFLAP
ncbi:MAG: DUF3160 domain-containing protein [Chloroflexi bacterium]|nr:DUF3160 domain-containing protein [Chloroflexota bacterium]